MHRRPRLPLFATETQRPVTTPNNSSLRAAVPDVSFPRFVVTQATAPAMQRNSQLQGFQIQLSACDQTLFWLERARATKRSLFRCYWLWLRHVAWSRMSQNPTILRRHDNREQVVALLCPKQFISSKSTINGTQMQYSCLGEGFLGVHVLWS